jgi:hypothetical protein
VADGGVNFDELIEGHPPSQPQSALASRNRWRDFLLLQRAWWARVLVVFVASRIVTTAILLWFADRQGDNAWTPPSPGYFDFARIWDGHWYFIVAAAGYPSELPLTADGHVAENAWAFMPAYPMLVRLLMALTGLQFPVIAVAVSVAFAAGTALLFYRLMIRVLPSGTALFAVVLFCVAPLSPILQVAYAESMHAFFLTLALILLLDRRYGMLVPVVTVMALTRPSGLAFALALAIHVAHRWFTRRTYPFSGREIAASVGVGLWSALAGVAWLLIAWGVTGSFTAYTDTELAWRAAYVGYGELVPFTPWVQSALFWLGQPAGGVIVAGGVLFLLGTAALLLSPLGRRLGVDMRFWVASYLLYLLAVFFPQSSTFRLLVPIFPLLGAIAIPRSRVYRASIVLLFILGQIGWIHVAYWVDGYDWTPP